jgi:hypothetical protein
MTEKPKRNFVVNYCVINGLEGNFKGATPGQAAKKITRKLFKLAPKSPKIEFHIRETTKDSAKKIYKYYGTKETLDPPLTYTRAGVEYTVHTKYNVKQIPK